MTVKSMTGGISLTETDATGVQIDETARRRRWLFARTVVAAFAIVSLGSTSAQASQAAKPPLDIMILGDSQLSFGSGEAFLRFFTNLPKSCAGTGLSRSALDLMADKTVGIMGVRSTGLHTWLSKTRRGKRMICVKDPTGLVNASAYGAARQKQKWVQVGESPKHRFCKPGRSALSELTRPNALRAKLMIFNFLGLSAARWRDRKRLAADLAELNRQLPAETGCLLLTTAPTYRADINAPRLRAQKHLKALLGDGRQRCSYVPGLTSRTVTAMQGNRALYYKHKNGRVKDPYHPNDAGAATFLRLRKRAICSAVSKALMGKVASVRPPFDGRSLRPSFASTETATPDAATPARATLGSDTTERTRRLSGLATQQSRKPIVNGVARPKPPRRAAAARGNPRSAKREGARQSERRARRARQALRNAQRRARRRQARARQARQREAIQRRARQRRAQQRRAQQRRAQQRQRALRRERARRDWRLRHLYN
ncbi:MAG: hypothetical protein AAFY64_09910 [Pseudomonadota bacterium]